MTEEELKAIEAHARGSFQDDLNRDDIFALVAEVRRLRGLLQTIANEDSSWHAAVREMLEGSE